MCVFSRIATKIKGWEKFISTTLVGVARDQHAWVALDGTRYNAVGTDRKLYVIEEGLVYDITPIRKQALTNPFTTNATTSVVVTDIIGTSRILSLSILSLQLMD